MLTASRQFPTPTARGCVARGVGLAVAAVAYIVFWMLALTLWSGARSIDLTPEGVIDLYGGAPVQASTTLIFSEGLAAVSLLILLVAIARTLRLSGASGAGWAVLVGGRGGGRCLADRVRAWPAADTRRRTGA